MSWAAARGPHFSPALPVSRKQIMDLTDLTPEALDQLRIDVLNEQERRANLGSIPTQVATLAEQYVTAGGNQADLAAAIIPS